MKKKLLLLALLCISVYGLNAQVYIDQSHTYGTNATELLRDVQFQGDYVYYIGTTKSAAYPVSNTSQSTTSLNTTNNDEWSIYKKVHKSTGAVVASAYIGPDMSNVHFKVRDGKVYLVGATIEDYTHPSKQNTPPGGVSFLYMELDESTGDLLYSKYFGGSGNESARNIDVSDDYVVFGSYTSSTDLPVTDTTTKSNSIGAKPAIFVLDKASRNLIYNSYFEGGVPSNIQNTTVREYILDGDKLYVIGLIHAITGSVDYISLINDANNFLLDQADKSVFLARLDLTTATWDYRTHFMDDFEIGLYSYNNRPITSDNDYLYILGSILQNADYTATNGTSSYGTGTVTDQLYLKVYKNTGGIVASGYFGGRSTDNASDLHVDGNSVYIAGRTTSDDLFVTDGSTRTSISNGFYVELDKNTANIIKSGYLGADDCHSIVRLTTDNNYIHLFSTADDLETIGGGRATQNPTQQELFYIRKDKSSGKTLYAGFLGDGTTAPQKVFVDSGYVYLGGSATSAYNYPITTSGLPSSYGSDDFYYTRFASCNFTPSFPADTLSPASQTVCAFGYVPRIDGSALAISGDSLPPVYRNLMPESQGDFEASYQWQEASLPAGPWSNITGAVTKNYDPTIEANTKYFRRLAYIRSCGDSNIISTSSVAEVNTNSNTAPTVDAGDFAYSCPGSTVTLGGLPAATGGTLPYTYSWFRGSETIAFDSVANPLTSAQNSTIHTLWVTDANGCTQIDQVVLNIVEVNAGPDVGSCAGDSAIIQAQGAAGLIGTTYSWLPTSGLNCATCLQPSALVSGAVDYELSMTIPKTGGGTCTMVDTVQVIETPGPLNPNFAGPDKVICFAGTTELGVQTQTAVAPIVSVSQSSTAAGGAGTVANMTDADFSTGAITNNTSTQWVSFDLGEERAIYSLDVSSITANSLDNVFLQVSNNNVNWTNISSMGAVSNTSLTNYTLPSIASARYIRFVYFGSLAMTVSELRVNVPTFDYTWAPANYLSSNNQSLVTYDPGTLSFPPTPNPATYYVTAEANGCVYYDTTVVSVIRANAGSDGCGPRNLGSNTDAPGLNEQFIWTKISGDGNFIGPTNVPYPLVTATTSGTTIYQLQTVYNGDTCTDQVEVPQCICGVGIKIAGDFDCPNANLGPVSLIANHTGLGSNVTWDWSPKVGLSNYNTAYVSLTDLTMRTYTVTARSAVDTTQFCSDTILVNDPNMTVPVFSAVDTTICPGDNIHIGAPNVAGYNYLWTPADNLSDPATSDPMASGVVSSTDYLVQVTDAGTGCAALDTASIIVQTVEVDAGPDWFVCQSAQIELGTPAVAGQSYAWTPQAPWQNGTDSSSAQPEPLIATSVDFYLAVTDSITGCTVYDTASVIVDNNPTLINYPDTLLCEGSSVFIGGDTALPGVTYAWSPTTGLANPTDLKTEVVGITSYQTYVLSATYPGNCPVATDSVVITVDNFSFSLNDTTYCPSGGAFSLGSGVPAAMSSYSWSPGNLVSNASAVNPTTLNPPPANETSFTLTITNSNGCVDTGVRKITPTTAAALAGSDKSICINETTTLGSTSNATGSGVTYVWSPTTDLSCTSCVDPIFTPSATGTFTYTLTRTDGAGCSSTNEVSVIVKALPISPLAQPVICQNTSVQIGTTANANDTYVWSPTAGLSDSTISNPIASPTATTVYTLTVIGGNGCVAQEPVAVTVNSTPSPTVEAEAVTICQSSGGGVMNASVSPAGNYSYLWTPSTGLSSATVLNPSFIAGNIGSTVYTLTVTDGTTGCTGNDTALITVDDCLASIGNYVWNDVNKDGIQNSNEVGVGGVTVYLLNAIGQVLDSTVTSSTGSYSFTELTPSTYGIQFNLNTLPDNYIVTAQDAGTDDALDSDGSPIDGYAGSATLVENENNTSFDLGIYESILPVVLTDFVLTEIGCNAQLDWTTASEQHTSHFNVMRSVNSAAFEKIGEVAAAGNSDVELHYSYSDEHLDGFYLYKLDMVDIDGQISQSETKGLLINCATMGQIKLYPNPVNDNLQVLSQLEQEDFYIVKLYDLTGRVIYQTKHEVEEGNDTFEIPMRSLASGSYFLVINGETIGKKEFKVLKQ